MGGGIEQEHGGIEQEHNVCAWQHNICTRLSADERTTPQKCGAH
jgi:hypothetical protein